MDDARHFTDYRPNCYVNNIIRANNQLLNSFEYRKFLTDNANKLMEMNRTHACQKNCCGPCKQPYDDGTMMPHQTVTTCNKHTCDVGVNNINGLGQGRNYGSPESRGCKSWPKGMPVKQPGNCCADNQSLFNYYDDVQQKAQGSFSRYTDPSGGGVFQGGDPKAYNH
jgi:hypothetical protein